MLEIVSHLSDEQVGALRRGGHSNKKVYAGYKRALESKGRPSVILAHTVKGWRLGEAFEWLALQRGQWRLARGHARGAVSAAGRGDQLRSRVVGLGQA